MHTLHWGRERMLEKKRPQVWSFGASTKGRPIEEEQDSFLPGEVTLPSKAVMTCWGSAGWSQSESFVPLFKSVALTHLF